LKRISEELIYSSEAKKTNQVAADGKYDACIILGDTNYRINGTKTGIFEAMRQNLFDVLLCND
jgi:hypothetical protein